MREKESLLLRFGVMALILSIGLACADSAVAAGLQEEMPWEAPLEKVINSISGDTAKLIGILSIVLAGLGLAFGEAGGGMRKMLWVVFGLSITFAASGFFIRFFGFASGALLP